MKSLKTNLSKIVLPGNMIKSTGFKLLFTVVLLFLSSSFLYSQLPTLEYRIVDLHYEDPCTMTSPQPAIVFTMEMRAGANYIGGDRPMIAADIMILYNLGPGVTINTSSSFLKSTVLPNNVGINNAFPTPYPYPVVYPNGIRLHYTRNYPLIGYHLNNFTYAWIPTATIYIPVMSGTPDHQTCLSICNFDGTPAHSFFTSGVGPDPGVDIYPFAAPCPSTSCVGVPSHAFFNFPIEYCQGDPPFTLPLTSNNHYTGTWDKPILQTSIVGLDTFVFTPNNPAICQEKVIITVNPRHQVTIVTPSLEYCGGEPYDLIDAVTVPANDVASDYVFYTSDDGGTTYDPSPATGLVQWEKGTYNYYVRYENPDSCFSAYIPFDVIITAPDTAIATVTCVSGDITDILITSPVGAPGDFEYSLDGVIYTSDLDFGGTFIPVLTPPQQIYVMDMATTCVSMVEVTCPPCADPPVITVISGSGKVCVDGTYTVTGSYVFADSVVVSHDGTGSLSANKFYPLGGSTSGTFSVTYTPGALDAGLVTLTFNVPATATCPEDTKTEDFTVYALPVLGSISSTFTEFTCTNSALTTTLGIAACAGCSYLWSGGTPPLTNNTVVVSSSDVASNGTTFTVTVTDANGCSDTESIIITKDILPPPPPLIDKTYQEFCLGATVADLAPAGLIWYNAFTAGTQYLLGDALVNGTIYYAAQVGANGCESVLRTSVKVSIVAPTDLGKPIIADQDLCDDALVSDIQTDGTSGIIFFDPIGAPLLSTDALVLSGTYSAIYSFGGGVCESTDIAYFEITLNNTKADDPVIAPQTFCEAALISNIKVPNDRIIWYYDDNVASLPLPSDTRLEAPSHTYWASQSKGGSCSESDRVPVVITLGIPPPPTTYEPYDLCFPASLADVNVSGFNPTWYNVGSSVPLSLSTAIPMGTHTYMVANVGSATCSSAQIPVVITVTNCGKLLDCAEMKDQTADEDYFKACKYTHIGTAWDAENASVITNPFDDVKYYINGTLSPSGATLDGAEFPCGLSHVMAVAFYGAITDTCYFDVMVERVCPSVSPPDGDSFQYPVSRVAGLCWTANLKTTTYMDGSPIAFAEPYTSAMYPDATTNTNTFGLLYTWYSAMDVTPEGDEAGVPATSQGICPDGWHVPTQAEQHTLNIWEATHLKSTSHWLIPGTNLSTYDSRGAGKYEASTDKYIDMLGFTGIWASDAGAGANAPYVSITYYLEDCDVIEKQTSKLDGLSVRCVWDGEACP